MLRICMMEDKYDVGSARVVVMLTGSDMTDKTDLSNGRNQNMATVGDSNLCGKGRGETVGRRRRRRSGTM